MGNNNKNGFKWRGFATFLLALGMFMEIISGIVLYITPPGRFANWTNWTFWGIDKHTWGAVHTVFGYLLLIIIVLHLYFNWRVILHFTWNKLLHTFNLKWELATALLIAILVFAGTLWNVPPFSTVMDLGNDAKLSWEKNSDNPLTRGGRWAQSTHENDGSLEAQRGGGRWALSNAVVNQGAEHMASEAESPRGRVNSNNETYGGGRGQGLGRSNPQESRTYGRQESQGNRNIPSEALKGRDYARLGKKGSVNGILVRNGSEWAVRSGDTLYEIHMGPSEYMADQGLNLKDGAEAHISGFIYENHVSVTRIETEGRSLTLRDDTGRPAWSGSKFSRGSGGGNFRNL